MPLIALVLSAIFLKEVINGRKVIGISLGAAGALMLVMGASACPAKEGAYGGYVLGDLLVLFAQFSYALYIVLFKGLVGKYSPVTIMKWMFTYSFLATVPFSYGEVAATNWNMDFSIALSLAFVVVGGTFGSYMLLAVGRAGCARQLPECTTLFSRWLRALWPYAGAWILSACRKLSPLCLYSAEFTW